MNTEGPSNGIRWTTRLIPVIALVVAVGTQTWRLQSSAADFAKLSSEHLRATGEAEHFETALIAAMKTALTRDELPYLRESGTTVYMVTDSDCGFCAMAADTMAHRGVVVPMVVTSFDDTPEQLAQWLVDHELPYPAVEALPHIALAGLPHTATPLFVEFIGRDPVDIHIGQPKEYWLGQP